MSGFEKALIGVIVGCFILLVLSVGVDVKAVGALCDYGVKNAVSDVYNGKDTANGED